MIWIWMAVVAVVVIFVAFVWFGRLRDKWQTGKVIRMSLHRKSRGSTGKGGSQLCSFCRGRSKRLNFYSDEAGKVVGVCEKCRPQAERRALLRL